MKRLLGILLAAALVCGCFAGCARGTGTETAGSAPAGTENSVPDPAAPNPAAPLTGEIVVFAAASLTETLTELGARFEAAHPGLKVVFNFESSGKLMDQITAGADCDLFLSAAPKQMDLLDATQTGDKNPDGQDFIDPATRLDLLENKVALAVPAGNPKGVASFDDLAQRLRAGTVLLAMGGEGVPVGQYTQKIFAYYGLEEAALAASGVLTYGENVKAVTTRVSEALVDCGVIYRTDAASAGLEVVDTAAKDQCGQVIYPAALLKNAQNPEAAGAFLAYLQTEEAGAVFASVGFTPLNG